MFIPEAPSTPHSVPGSMALLSLLRSIWGVLKGSWLGCPSHRRDWQSALAAFSKHQGTVVLRVLGVPSGTHNIIARMVELS